MNVEREMYNRAIKLIEKRYPKGWGGASVIRTEKGRYLSSVSIDTFNDGVSLCIETGAICEASKYDEKVTHCICVVRDDENSPFKVLSPCGVCQERLRYWGGNVKVAVTTKDDTLRFIQLKELQPYHWTNAYEEVELESYENYKGKKHIEVENKHERRVLLRDLKIEDADDRYRWSLDTEVTKYLSVPDKYPPFTMEETEAWLKLCSTHTNGYYQKAIITEKEGHIGWVDLKNFDKVNKSAELGIAIGEKSAWGKGYGVEAIIEMVKVGFEEYGLEKIWLRVDIDNVQAMKCYERCGFTNEGIMRNDRWRRGEFIDRCRYSILKDEFLIEIKEYVED